MLNCDGMIVLGRSRSTSTSAVDSDAPNLKVYHFSSLKAATNNFSIENKLGEGGFGPRLQDPTGQYFMDWRKRVHIIEGIIQELLYLQEYSNFTIIHRDLKASNILHDDEMNAKISDFGMAKLFRKDELEGNTRRIVVATYLLNTYEKGIYSMKYDVYSFGVLLLQMISGRKSTHYYGPNESMHLLEYACVSWKEDKGLDFIDPSLDDSSSSCKLLRCLQVALLCVQENADDRPTMLEVYSMLISDTQAVPTPTKTAFSVKNYDNVDNICTPQPGNCSVNDAQISELQPR
ncbi:receptor-like serine/threonine-protein kinase SD1-6 [Malus domestica]|uniref:receptor-like serine/threonine-protein kinase SD1-6 n=1 Tax=Malus domestica TaxID=3750 RepID=UPI003975DF60